MEFTEVCGVGGSSNVSVGGERCYSCITSQVSSDATTDRSSLHSFSHGPDWLISSGANLLKHCRPGNDLDVYEEARGPFKHSRTDPFAQAHIDRKLQMSGGSSALMRSNSVVSDGRLTSSSPSNSTASDIGLLASDFPALDVKPLRSDGLMMAQVYAGGNGVMHGPPLYQDFSVNSSGMSLPMARDGLPMPNTRGPFTAEQMLELHQHAFIFKCIAEGVSPPAALLIALRNSLSLNGLAAATYSGPRMTFNLGSHTTTDPEPGRCRRTDGKKWRCAREVVPEQKYCERHMNRGRNRSRKSADCQASTLSQASGAVQPPSSNTTSSAVAVSSGKANREDSNPEIAANRSNGGAVGVNACSQQQPMGVKNPPTSYSSLPVGLTARNQLQFPLHQASAAAAAGTVNKDIRFFPGEHIFLPDSTASKRLLYDHHSLNNLAMMNAVNGGFQVLPPQQYGLSSQMKTLLASDVTAVSEGSCYPNRLPFSASVMGSMDVCRESEGQPLRRFFDDWPRSRDSATLSWPDLEDEKVSQNVSNTHLSISIPTTQMDFQPSSGSSPRARAIPSSLKLSMARNESDPMGGDLTRMGLSMGPVVKEEPHRQSNWVSIAWENSMGGPLAEVLHSSTPRGGKNPGLNLLGEGWDGSPQDSPRMASPTGVLQKATLGSYSDSSSSASSPRAIKTEPGLRENNIQSPSLANAASHLSS